MKTSEANKKQEWKTIPFAPNYEVSNCGEVASWLPERNFAKPPAERRTLKLRVDKNGYKRATLICADGKKRHYRVCRLVAIVWIGQPEGKLVVRHLDGSKDNDQVRNLQWGTPAENSQDSKRHGTWAHGSKVNTARLTEANVRHIKSSNQGHSELAREFGVTPCAIWQIRDGRTWAHVT